ncbi:hypothetical protein VCUG_00669 [Vavraia culicis subsp. floridensis]|uniref:Uncharacterized protein n=1 Tax=Vavraia culicis (isolate floridensis) TaxID=948595 RepID=L2GWV4_VAVCU|nr:uncharacterized protein VCUG_00669 [Vavraia culicis subsp. floridensis]ELA47827.1 hypothetical protein VCUG_00669 [Vavraia culicis subsp. floridensis]
MEDFEEKIKREYRNGYLPQEIVERYIQMAGDDGLILDQELKKLPARITLKDLKDKLTEFRRNSFLHGSFESLDNDVVYTIKENHNNATNCDDTSHYISKIKNKTNGILGREQTMYHSFDDKFNNEKKEQRLRNVLNAYYEYEMMKMNKVRDEQRGKNRIYIIIGSFIAFGLFLIVLVLLLDFLEINKPY